MKVEIRDKAGDEWMVTCTDGLNVRVYHRQETLHEDGTRSTGWVAGPNYYQSYPAAVRSLYRTLLAREADTLDVKTACDRMEETEERLVEAVREAVKDA